MNIPMKSLDTLKIYERLKKAETSDVQAKELAEILRELTDDQIAQKNDLKNTEMTLQNDLKKTEAILQNDLEKFRNELKADIEKLKIDLDKTRSELQADIEKTRSELKTDIEKLRVELEAKISSEVSKSKIETIKWIIGWVTGLIIAQTGFMLAYLK